MLSGLLGIRCAPVSVPSRIGPGTETGTLTTVSVPYDRRFGPTNRINR